MSKTSRGLPSGPPPHSPGRMVPPYRTIPGLFSRPRAINVPGMFLSQPGITTMPSSQWPPATDSTESAIKSLDCSEKDTGRQQWRTGRDSLPLVPMLMPSETARVPNWYPIRPALLRDFFARCPSPRMCLLHGLPSYLLGASIRSHSLWKSA